MALSFTDCVAIGYITSDIQKRTFPLSLNETDTNQPDYYNFTRDTSFQTFPIDNSPQCIPEKHFIVPISLTLAEKLLSTSFILFLFLPLSVFAIVVMKKKEKNLWNLCWSLYSKYVR